MKYKGWVYILSNKAMPGLLKIGYSKKDPKIRAYGLYNSGNPHPYIVDYEILIDDPYIIEQKIHRQLSSKREGKEWFRCSIEEAIAAFKTVAGTQIIHESSTNTAKGVVSSNKPEMPNFRDFFSDNQCRHNDIFLLRVMGGRQYFKCKACGEVLPD